MKYSVVAYTEVGGRIDVEATSAEDASKQVLAMIKEDTFATHCNVTHRDYEILEVNKA